MAIDDPGRRRYALAGPRMPRAPPRDGAPCRWLSPVSSEGGRHMFARPFRRDRGQGLVEYALILALVAIVVIGILILLGPAIGSIFSNVSSAL